MSEKKEARQSDLRLIKNVISESIFKVNKDIEFSDWDSEDGNDLDIKVE
ncbi:hypothetical protein PJ964_002897, partial [Enterococcus faecalis]|nr:hypothetical protein [Enterococcus faecalis]